MIQALFNGKPEYRIRIANACGYISAFTEHTTDTGLIKAWAKNNRKVYPNNTIVIQTLDASLEWHDYRLMEDFIKAEGC